MDLKHINFKKKLEILLSHIEIWQNIGNEMNPNYQGKTLDNADDVKFDILWPRELVIIDYLQCN